jgi:TrmH family RNA methyltransferase
MLSKKVVKDIQSLGLKKYREETGLFVAEGRKTVEELLKIIPQQIVAIYATAEWSKGKVHEHLETIEDIELEKLSSLKTPNEVVAVIKQSPTTTPGDSFLRSIWIRFRTLETLGQSFVLQIGLV